MASYFVVDSCAHHFLVVLQQHAGVYDECFGVVFHLFRSKVCPKQPSWVSAHRISPDRRGGFEQRPRWLLSGGCASVCRLFLKRTGFLGVLGKSFFMLLGTLLLLEFLLFSIPGMQDYLDYYLHKQLLPTLSGQREKQVENPFSFLLDLASQLALPGILLLFYLVKTRFKGVKVSKSAFYFIALGLAGSLPLMLTPKQSTHYLLPSIPYFALGLASILGQAIAWPQALDAPKGRLLEKMAGGLLLVVVLVSCSFWGKFRRDEILIQDITAICTKVGKGTTLGTPPHFSDQWLLHAYFGRLGNVSLDARNQHDYWLMEKGGMAPDGFQPVMLDMNQWSLWQRK